MNAGAYCCLVTTLLLGGTRCDAVRGDGPFWARKPLGISQAKGGDNADFANYKRTTEELVDRLGADLEEALDNLGKKHHQVRKCQKALGSCVEDFSDLKTEQFNNWVLVKQVFYDLVSLIILVIFVLRAV